jgi:hypothetical protein
VALGLLVDVVMGVEMVLRRMSIFLLHHPWFN